MFPYVPGISTNSRHWKFIVLYWAVQKDNFWYREYMQLEKKCQSTWSFVHGRAILAIGEVLVLILSHCSQTSLTLSFKNYYGHRTAAIACSRVHYPSRSHKQCTNLHFSVCLHVSEREAGDDTRLLGRNGFCNDQQYCRGCLGMLEREKKRKRKLQCRGHHPTWVKGNNAELIEIFQHGDTVSWDT